MQIRPVNTNTDAIYKQTGEIKTNTDVTHTYTNTPYLHV